MDPADPLRALRRLLAGIAAVAAAWWTGTVLLAFLVNTAGPMGSAALLAAIVAVVGTVLVAGAVLVGTTAVARRSIGAGVGCAVAVVVAAWVLAPMVVDRHQSFVDPPDRTATCSGWEFDHYPPGTSDASELVYCVGVEHPVDG